MYTTLIGFVSFSSITLAPMMACILVAMALVLPMMGMAWVVSSLEEIYWVQKFSEAPPHFVLPPEIACLPLEADESKSLFCTIGGLVIEPEGSVPPVVTLSMEKIDRIIAAILQDMNTPKIENSLLIWS